MTIKNLILFLFFMLFVAHYSFSQCKVSGIVFKDLINKEYLFKAKVSIFDSSGRLLCKKRTNRLGEFSFMVSEEHNSIDILVEKRGRTSVRIDSLVLPSDENSKRFIKVILMPQYSVHDPGYCGPSKVIIIQ